MKHKPAKSRVAGRSWEFGPMARKGRPKTRAKARRKNLSKTDAKAGGSGAQRGYERASSLKTLPAKTNPSGSPPALNRAASAPAAVRAGFSHGAAAARSRPSAAAFEPDAYCEPVPQEEEKLAKSARKASFEVPYGTLRDGEVYPDPFPYEPPSAAEVRALRITPIQRIALEKILLGSQLSVAARAAGVTRMTLYRWLHRDPNFQAAYNTWHADAIINSRTRLMGMTNAATSTLEFAVHSDPRMALAVLKANKVFKQTTAVPTDPEECRRQIERNEREKERSRREPNGAILHAPSGASVGGFGGAFRRLAFANGVNGAMQVESHAVQQETEERPSAGPRSLPVQSSIGATDDSAATRSQEQLGREESSDKALDRREPPKSKT